MFAVLIGGRYYEDSSFHSFLCSVLMAYNDQEVVKEINYGGHTLYLTRDFVDFFIERDTVWATAILDVYNTAGMARWKMMRFDIDTIRDVDTGNAYIIDIRVLDPIIAQNPIMAYEDQR